MKYRFSNDPNYEENEKIRQEQSANRRMAEQRQHQQLLARITNKYLDKVQYAFDHKKYIASITGKLWNKKKVIEIVLGNTTFGKIDADLQCMEVMSAVARCIKTKYPQWEVRGFYSDFFSNKGNGNYGIMIICEVNDFD